MKNRWKETAIGKQGESLADELAPAVERWLDGFAPGEFDPVSLGIIARDVVHVICEERGLYRAFNAKRGAR